MDSHVELKSFHLEHIFPQVQMVTIFDMADQCAECGYDSMYVRPHFDKHQPKLKPCARAMLAQFNIEWINKFQHFKFMKWIGDFYKPLYGLSELL